MKKCKISLIIPVFNVEEYLTKALDSVVLQTFGFENIEVILVDDCSTDGSADIIRQYVDKYDNVRGFYLDECSGFPGKPRNIGLEKATSDYIMFLDSDDCLENTACEMLYNTIIAEDADIVSGSYTTINKKGVRKLNEWAWTITLTSPDLEKGTRKKMAKELLSAPDFKYVVTDLDEKPTILGNSNIWCKIYKRSVIEDMRFPEDIVAQDSVFLLESFYRADKIVFIKDIIVHYNNKRVKDENRSVSFEKTNRNLYGRIRAYDLMNDISIRYDRKELFDYYLLGTKLDYWYEKYLLETEISAADLRDLFNKYSHLFKASYMAGTGLSENTKKVFGQIYEDNIDNAVNLVLNPQNPESPKKNKNGSVFKKIMKKIRK